MTEAGEVTGVARPAPGGAAPEVTPGVVLDGKYRLKARLGRGGFGDVWRADELLPDGAPFREVALKLLAGIDLDARSWAEEAKLLASFRHASLVTIFAAGILRDGTRFVAMEVLEGHNLAEISRARGRVPWRRVLSWALEAASALDVIHTRGVVHLDLKPANLFVARDGALKVLDFGIARQAGVAPPSRSSAALVAELGATMAQPAAPTLRERAASGDARAAAAADGDAAEAARPHDVALAATRLATRATDASGHAVVGTPGYIAPEVLACREPTPAADGYALAVCIAQLATGRLPHDAPDEPEDWNDASAVSSWLEAVRGASMLGALRPLLELPPGVRSLVQRLCAADPDARGHAPGGLAAIVSQAVRMPYGAPQTPYFPGQPLPREAEGLLFGRDDETARLGRDLAFEGSLVVQGGRGVGKTSLVRVGIAPHIAREAFDGMDDWRLVEVAPGDDPDAALTAALLALDPTLGDADAAELEAWAASEQVGVAIFVDPLEDAAAAPPERRGRLERLAEDLARETFSGVRLLASLSDERAGVALATSLGAALRSSVRFVGGPSPSAARDIVVRPAEIAGAEVVQAEPVVVEIERELRAGGGRLPVVAMALSAWWASREPLGTSAQVAAATPSGSASQPVASATGVPPTHASSGAAATALGDTGATPSASVVEHHPSGKVVIREGRTGGATSATPRSTARAGTRSSSQRTPRSTEGAQPRSLTSAAPTSRRVPTCRLSGARFRERGGVRGALSRHADATLAALDPAARLVAESLLVRLTATDGTPRALREVELIETAGTPEAPAVLGALESAGLVGRAGGEVGLAHEGLATSWPRLADLRLSRMEELGLLERIREAAATWEREGERRAFLLSSHQLVELTGARGPQGGAWRIAGRVPGLTAREQAFVDASLVGARRRRLARGAGGIATLLLVAGGLFSWRALEIARHDEERAKNAAIELEYTGDLAAKSRRAADPYARAAFAAEAMTRGALDGALPVELTAAAARAARADVLTLDKVSEPAFFWGDRWLLAFGASGDLVAVDFKPREPDVIEDVDIDVDPTMLSERPKRPRVQALRVFEAPVAEIAPFAFDTSFAARSIDGEVKILRLREDGLVALAATAPMRCVGALHLARAAPVVACATDRGLARWDLRAGGRVDHAKAECGVEDISPDGARVAGRVTRRVVVWTPATSEERTFAAPFSVSFARFSPDGRALAVAGGRLDVVDAADPKSVLFSADLEVDPVTARWDDGGLDVGLCDAAGVGRWAYLRKGHRDEGDPPPRGHACRAAGNPSRPEAFGAEDKPEELRDKDVGGHLSGGGFRLSHRRILSRDLVLFDPASAGASSLLSFHGKDELGEEADDDAHAGPSRVVREGSVVAVQMGDEVRIYGVADGARYATRRGSLLGRCADGRLLAARSEELGVRIFDVWTGHGAGWVRAEPGLYLVGVDARCAHALTQRLSGEITAHALGGDGFGEARAIAQADGYVFDARPARSAFGLAAGLWVALGSGAIARIGGDAGDTGPPPVRVVAQASPRATAIADGPAPGEVTFADAAGVAIADVRGRVRRVLDSYGDDWTDVAPSLETRSMLLAGDDGVAVLDMIRKEIIATIPLPAAGRFAPWDDEGSVLLYAPGHAGAPSGVVIPRSRGLARAAASLMSNLEVEGGRLATKR